jgi:hypothetical protein
MKIVIIAVKKTKQKEGESFGEMISRLREKYAEALDTNDIFLKVV